LAGKRSRLAALRAAMVDTTPLRTSRAYRWLYTGQAGFQFGRQVLVVAVPLQVFELTGSSLQVGLVSLVQTIPLLLFAPLGGVAADAFDRRRILAIAQVLTGLASIGLALNSTSSASLWPIYLLMAINAGMLGVEAPTRTAIIPTLVARDQLASAFALNQTLNQTASVVGPALGGLLIAGLGLGATYWISAVTMLLASLAAIPLGPLPPEAGTGRLTLSATGEALRYLRRRPLLQQVMLIDLNAMVFGMPRALFPAFGTVLLGGDATTVGLLNAAPGAGALAAAATTGWVSAVRRQGRVVVIAVTVWGLAVVGFGLTRNLMLALIFLAVAGAGDIISNVFRSTILQLDLPDSIRGRISAFKTVITAAGPRFGDVEAGAVAALTTPTFSIVSGGLVSVIGAWLIAWRGRALWDQDADQVADQHRGGT
jgi:MFS family permease